MVLQELGEKLISSLKKLANEKAVDDKFFNSFLTEMVNSLREADVKNQVVIKFMMNIKRAVKLDELEKGVSARKVIEREVFTQLVELVDPHKEPYRPQKGKLNVYMLIGLQGSGKTTTCTKLAYFYKHQGFKVGVVGADTFRAGAREQLLQNARLADVPYYVDFISNDPIKVAFDGVSNFRRQNYDIVIVDTSGKNSQESALFQEMQEVYKAINPDECIFVMDGTIGQAAFDQATAFQSAVGVGSIIITKLDSSAKGGGAISAVAATGAPISFYGTGEDVMGLEIFEPHSFISRMLGYGDPTALMAKMNSLVTDENEELVKKMISGQYGFREMYNQYEMFIGMGDIGSIIDMMGMRQMIPRDFQTKDLDLFFKKVLHVIDSMTDKELDNPGLFKEERRRRRLARGCGMPLEFIQTVIQQQKQFAQVLARMNKSGLGKLMQAEQKGQMNEKSLMQAMNSMGKSLAGKNPKAAEGISSMLKGMFGGGGMPPGMQMPPGLGAMGLPSKGRKK